MTYVRPEICCVGDRIPGSDEGRCRANELYRGGYTPIDTYPVRRLWSHPMPERYLPGQVRPGQGRALMVREARNGVDCMRFTWVTGGRLGPADNALQALGLGVGRWAPYIWVGVNILMCCDGFTDVRVRSSRVPRAYVYIKGNRSTLSGWGDGMDEYWRRIVAFMNSGPEAGVAAANAVALAPGSEEVRDPTWVAGR